LPHVLAALRVRPGSGVDQALLRALHFFAGLAVFDHNARHGDRVRVVTSMQDKVEVKYLTGGKAFPAGLEPALALKDGYLLLANSPEAIRRFRAGGTALEHGGETPLLRLSLPELRTFLKNNRVPLTALLAAKHQTSVAAAGQGLDVVLECLGLVQQLELTQRAQDGQLVLTLRLRTKS
jgi:hypothetical protein